MGSKELWHKDFWGGGGKQAFYTSMIRSQSLNKPTPRLWPLAWKIPWTEEPGRLQSTGSLRVRHDWVTSLSLFIFMHWRRKWQPTPVVLPGESQGWGSLVGCCLWGPHRVEHDWSDLAAAAADCDLYKCFSIPHSLAETRKGWRSTFPTPQVNCALTILEYIRFR